MPFRKMKLERNFYRPDDARLVAGDEDRTCVYFYESNRGHLYAVGYWGRSQKPAFHFRYDDEEARIRQRDSFMAGWIDHLDRKQQKAAAKKAFRTSLEPGSILVSTWGYDQTNVDFYLVTEVSKTGRSVKVSKLGCESIKQTGPLSDLVVPFLPDRIGDDGKWRRVTKGEHINVDDLGYGHASKWGGNAVNRSWGH